jgi:hypothetical protein
MRCLFAIFIGFGLFSCGAETTSESSLKETHPYQAELICKRPPGSSLVGRMINVANGSSETLGDFVQGHVGSCEFAVRASRNGRVCLPKGGGYTAIQLATRAPIQSFRDLKSCTDFTKGWGDPKDREGFVEFIDDLELAKLLQHLPRVSDKKIDGVLHSPDTMWYDESSLVFSYQDSFGNPQGLRANRVGYDVGSNNSNADIKLLTKYFKHGKFRFPFSVAAGSDFDETIYVMNFWAPPKSQGKAIPVAWWKNQSHWNWVFPVGTTIGEVLFMKSPDDQWLVFEVRSRVRAIDQWQTNVFRPFASATDMATEIKKQRPNWSKTDLSKLVSHLLDQESLVAATLDTTPYDEIVLPIDGHFDSLPHTTDASLMKSFLTTRVFSSVMGKTWKKNGDKRTFAATTQSNFSIVPKNYIGGLLETSEKACANCHVQTGRPVGQLDGRIVLYGEIWGEDRVFTWHPFEVGSEAFGTFDESRRVNPRLQNAGLLVQKKPGAQDPLYRELPRPYNPDYTDNKSAGE